MSNQYPTNKIHITLDFVSWRQDEPTERKQGTMPQRTDGETRHFLTLFDLVCFTGSS